MSRSDLIGTGLSDDDDFVAAFSLDGAPGIGRIVRLGQASVDAILRRHNYPIAVATMLGEAIALSALMGSLMKVEGRFVVQAQGDGPVPLMVAEHRGKGALRAYARVDGERSNALVGARRLSPNGLVGAGVLAMTLDRGTEGAAHQGVAPLDGASLAACAEGYFIASEQVATRIRLAVGEVAPNDGPPYWRAGGMLMQRIGRDAAREDPEEDWRRATMLFDTVSDAELIDPALNADRLLYRLFHEEGVRMGAPLELRDACSCSCERLSAILRGLSAEALSDLREPDGAYHARCQFCARAYHIAEAALRVD